MRFEVFDVVSERGRGDPEAFGLAMLMCALLRRVDAARARAQRAQEYGTRCKVTVTRCPASRPRASPSSSATPGQKRPSALSCARPPSVGEDVIPASSLQARRSLRPPRPRPPGRLHRSTFPLAYSSRGQGDAAARCEAITVADDNIAFHRRVGYCTEGSPRRGEWNTLTSSAGSQALRGKFSASIAASAPTSTSRCSYGHFVLGARDLGRARAGYRVTTSGPGRSPGGASSGTRDAPRANDSSAFVHQ